MNITSSAVKELREQTGAGMMDCKKALTEAEGSIDKARDILRQKGLAMASKKTGREASEGLISSYIHMNKIGVLVEVNCETDFVAKTEEFKSFVKDIAMHIAAAYPVYVKREDIPQEIMEKEKNIYAAQITNKPANIIDKIVQGKLEKYYEETCLLDQTFVKDQEQKKKIKDLLVETIAQLGENIILKRFVRFQLGEKSSS
ncbi:MAG: translation elongation factor Ts [Nitrospiraceae bacterium]|nr:MAG: translation elongation factor Ts [Nitrospiraceae bacterium]